MSRAPHLIQAARFGQKMGDVAATDHLTGILTDPFGHGIMGITAENVAERYGVSRADQTRSPSRASAAPRPPSRRAASTRRSCP